LNIEEVVPDSPAAKAGLVPNDRITEFAGTPIDDSDGKGFDQLTRLIARCKPGDTVAIKVLRGGETVDKTVTFDRWGDDTRTKLNSPEMQQGALQLQLRRNGGRIIIHQGGQIIPVQPGQPIQLQPVPVPQQRR
jgi:predicted metalloprotease with PDZ domain